MAKFKDLDIETQDKNRNLPYKLGKAKYCKLLTFNELKPKEQSEFDYIEDSEKDYQRFFRAFKWIYDANDMMCIEDKNLDYHVYHGETFFSGIFVKICDDDRVKVVQYFT